MMAKGNRIMMQLMAHVLLERLTDHPHPVQGDGQFPGNSHRRLLDLKMMSCPNLSMICVNT